MENVVKERIKMIFKDKNVTVNSLYKELNIPQTTLNGQINGDNEVNINTVIAIIRLYEDICSEWLLTGKGEMYKNYQNSENNSGTGIIGNNVNGGGINDNKIIQEMIEMLKKKDEQIDKLLQIIQKDK